MKYLIISGGSIQEEFALSFIKENKYDKLFAADSGMDFLYRNRIKPDIIAGDFDSVKGESLIFFANMSEVEIIRLNPIKDDTDTEFVIREAVRRGATEITILGATGTRLDHVMANIHLLGIGLQEKLQIRMVDAYNQIRMISGEVHLKQKEQFGSFVSLIPVGGDAKGVSLRGFKYPLTEALVPQFSSLCVSNEIVEEKACIQIQEGIMLLIESKD